MRRLASYLATLLSVAFLFSPIGTSAQLEAEVDHDQLNEFAESMTLPVGGTVDAQFFFVNNEYFTPQIEGYTLVGYTLRPTMAWRIANGLSLVGGLHVLQYGGEDHVHSVSPYFAADWRINTKMHLRLGSLPGPQSHRLHEAVLEPEMRYTERPEVGLQFSYAGSRTSGHLWVNWRQFIMMGDTIPERFTAGITAQVEVADDKFAIPFSLVFNHIGGQISDYPDRMQSMANLSVAPTVTIADALRLRFNALYFRAMAGTDVRPFANGMAISPELLFCHQGESLDFEAKLAWFRGRDFFSPAGNFMFSSLSNFDPDVYKPHRSLTHLDLSLVKWLGVAQFKLGVRGFYDTFCRRFDYAYSATMVVWPHTRNLWNRDFQRRARRLLDR